MQDSLEKVKQTWQTLGQEDPLWAIGSVESKRGGKWDIQEFLATAEGDLDHYQGLLRRYAQGPDRFKHVLDFGCGVGRLSIAWGRRSEQVTGVDISRPMIERGNSLLGDVKNVRLLVNEASDLSQFKTNTFDLVFSHSCLQHVPWELASSYLREFARVCTPGGWVVFNLPARVRGAWSAGLRHRLVDALPFGLGRAYRRMRHGSEAVFEMNYTPVATVESTLKQAGLNVLHREADQTAGEKAEGYVYLSRKR